MACAPEPGRRAPHCVVMPSLTTMIGLLAAFCTTIAYIPQLKKCWRTGRTGDLSLQTFSILTTGVALWVLYGVLQKDAVIIVGNSVSLTCLAIILYFKLREGSVRAPV